MTASDLLMDYVEAREAYNRAVDSYELFFARACGLGSPSAPDTGVRVQSSPSDRMDTMSRLIEARDCLDFASLRLRAAELGLITMLRHGGAGNRQIRAILAYYDPTVKRSKEKIAKASPTVWKSGRQVRTDIDNGIRCLAFACTVRSDAEADDLTENASV